MNIVSFHKRDLQLVIQYLSIARIKRLSEKLRFFSANPNVQSGYYAKFPAFLYQSYLITSTIKELPGTKIEI